MYIHHKPLYVVCILGIKSYCPRNCQHSFHSPWIMFHLTSHTVIYFRGYFIDFNTIIVVTVLNTIIIFLSGFGYPKALALSIYCKLP